MPAIANILAPDLPREHGSKPYLGVSETPEVKITELRGRDGKRLLGIASQQPRQPNPDCPTFPMEFSTPQRRSQRRKHAKGPVFGLNGPGPRNHGLMLQIMVSTQLFGLKERRRSKTTAVLFLEEPALVLIRHVHDIITPCFAGGGGVRIGSPRARGGDGAA